MSDSGPGGKFKTLTKSDTTVLVGCRALYIASDGDVYVDDGWGNLNVAFLAAKAGSILPICPFKLRTGTTSTVVGIFSGDAVSG